MAPIVAKLTARQGERDALLAEIGGADAVGQLKLDKQRIERTVLEKVDGWNRLLASRDTADGRQALREVLDGPIRFVRDGRTYRFEGGTTTGERIAALLGLSTLCGVPSGN